MTKLLTKPLRAFALYALIILLISVPVYFYVVDYIWISELDEQNWLTLEHTKKKLQSNNFTHEDIETINEIWGQLQPGVSILKAIAPYSLQDSVYQVIRPNEYDTDDGEDRFRGLKSYVEIKGQPYQITIETNVEESDETFLAIAGVTLLFFVILIVGFILLNRKIAASSWRPFYQTLRELQSFELSKDHALTLPTTDIYEFQELNQSLEQLVSNNVDTFQRQKSFIENASHELQTPLALLKSKLDLLLQQKDISPEISGLLDDIEAPLSRLSRINKNLLVLAKVENHQYNEKQELNIREFMESTLTLFEDYIVDKKLSVNNTGIQDTFLINANPFLVETLIHNLFSNAIRHTFAGGKMIIKSENKSIIILNSGKLALNEKHLFERFSTTSEDKVSSGLGLAIIKEIVNKYGWQIDYHFENKFHSFSVTF